MNFTGALHDWALAMAGADRSLRTIQERLIIMTVLAKRTDPMTASWRDLSEWLNTEGWARSTKRTYYDCLRAFYRWLLVVDYRADDPTIALPQPRAVRGVPRPISTGELGKLLSTVNRRRTRTMVILGAYQGLRVHEIAKIRGEHIRGGSLRVIGKGEVDSTIPLHELVEQEALTYPRIGLWFPSYGDPAKPVTSKNVSRVISDVMSRAGVDGTAHQLRHWCATEMLEAGADVRTVQEILRHASLATTAIYTKVSDHKRRAAVDSLPTPLHIVR